MPSKKFPALLALLLGAALVHGAEESPAPKHHAAVAAELKQNAAIKTAFDQYVQALILAKSTYVKELDAALKLAMKDTNLAEAKLIEARLKEAQSELQELKDATLPPQSYKATIHATRGWQQVCKVKKGDVISLRATGTWSIAKTSPDGTVGPQGRPDGDNRLVGRVGKQKFEIGEAADILIEETGTLEAGPGTDPASRIHRDDDGSITLTATRKGLPRP